MKESDEQTSLEDIFGPVIMSYTRAQALEDGVLVDAGALAQVNDQTILIKPLRASPQAKEVLVHTQARGRRGPRRGSCPCRLCRT